MRSDLPGDWSGLVVICAANFWHGIRYQDRHIAEHLATSRPVLYVDPPLSLLTKHRRPHLADAVEGARLRLVAPAIARLTPVVLPGQLRPGMAPVTARLMRRLLRQSTRTLGASVDTVIAAAPFLPLFGACDERFKVYWAQDDLAGGAELFGLDASRIVRGEQRRAAEADALVVANPLVGETWRARGYDPVLIPFGCDDLLYSDVETAPLPPDVDLRPPIVGFVGYLGSRIDFDLMEAVAQRGRSLLLVGPRHWKFDLDRVDHLLSLPNVCWVGEKPFEALPSYQRLIDVGIVPYADSQFNRGSFPLKTLEYLSAGRAAVTTDLPAVRWLDTDLITIAGEGPQAFADAVDAALFQERTPEIVDRRQKFAAQHGWGKRAAEFAALIDDSRAARAAS